MIESEPRDDPQERRTRLSLCLLKRVAEADGVDPVELDPPLNDVVDAVALDRLFESTPRDDRTRRGSVSFRYRDYDVTVHSDGCVELT